MTPRPTISLFAAFAKGRHAERARTKRLLAALREAGETAYEALAFDGAATERDCESYRAAVTRLMAQWCREHGEGELAPIFEREGG